MKYRFISWFLLFKLRDQACFKVSSKAGKKYSRANASNRAAGAKRKWKGYGAHKFEKKARICDAAINYYSRTIPLT